MRLGVLSWIALFAVCLTYLGLTVWILPLQLPVRFGTEGDAIAWFDRQLFIVWMVGFLLGLNALFAGVSAYISRGKLPSRVQIPWKSYWLASSQRRGAAVSRLKDVMVLAGLMVNASWLMSYHLVMQEAGASLVVKIPINFGIYMILVSALVMIYGTVIYFRPP